MTRIIAGTSRGRRLATPPGDRTRPTSDRVREALFSRLEHLDAIDGVAVLDLYAGSGALGLEALSRGAARVVLVESARKAAGIARRNAADVSADAARARHEEHDAPPEEGPGGPSSARPELAVVVGEPVERYLRGTPGLPFGLVFIDPPYDLSQRALAEVLQRLTACLEPDALVVVERSSRSPEPTWPPPAPDVSGPEEHHGDTDAAVGLELADDRRYGETRLWFARAIGPASADGDSQEAGATSVSVRRTSPADWEVVRDLRLAALHADPDAFGSTLAREEAFGRQEWEERCGNPDSYVAFLDGRPAGLASLMPLSAAPPLLADSCSLESNPRGDVAADSDGSVRDVVGLWTDPSARGHGVGAELVSALIETARARGASGLRLMVTRVNEPAIRLYRRFGFSETGMTKPMPDRPHLCAMEMTADLSVRRSGDGALSAGGRPGGS